MGNSLQRDCGLVGLITDPRALYPVYSICDVRYATAFVMAYHGIRAWQFEFQWRFAIKSPPSACFGLFIRSRLFQSHSILLSRPPTPVNSDHTTPGLHRTDMGVCLALWTNTCSGLLALALRWPNHYLHHVYALMCAYFVYISLDYETTKAPRSILVHVSNFPFLLALHRF